MTKKRNLEKDKNSNVEVWTEEQTEEYMKGLYGMDFIAGYTEGGVPYGTYIDEEEEPTEYICSKRLTDSDEIPF